MTASQHARATAVAAKGPIGDLGGNWMMSDAEEQATTDAGMVDWQLYFLGRHGVLGDVDTDVILAAAFFFPPDHLRREWATARALMTPAEGLSRYLAVCHQWGRDRLAGFGDVDRLSELGQMVVDASGVVGLPLFAGWRAVPLPDAGPASGADRCAQVMQVLREHRGACHGVALAALQLDPLGCDPREPRWRGERHRVRVGAAIPPGDRRRTRASGTRRGTHRRPRGRCLRRTECE